MSAWRTCRRALWLAVVVLLPAACSADSPGPERYIAGEHYTALEQPVATQSQEKIEVIEFFLYSCSHCNAFEPTVKAWAAGLSEDVAFRRMPVTFSALGPLFAQTFYTAQDLGVFEKMHPLLFDAIHEEKRQLVNPAAVRDFFVEHGVAAADFEASFNSGAVKAQVKRAAELMQAYRIDGVPALAIDGKYSLNGRQTGGNDAMVTVADFLINKTRASR